MNIKEKHMTFQQLKNAIDKLTPEQLAEPVRWWGDERGGTIEKEDLQLGQTVLAGFMNGYVEMTVVEDTSSDWYLLNEDMISLLEFDEKWGWLATGFVNKKAIQKLRLDK